MSRSEGNLGRGVGLDSRDPYDQNLRFLCAGTGCPNPNLWVAYVDGFIHNDETDLHRGWWFLFEIKDTLFVCCRLGQSWHTVHFCHKPPVIASYSTARNVCPQNQMDTWNIKKSKFVSSKRINTVLIIIVPSLPSTELRAILVLLYVVLSCHSGKSQNYSFAIRSFAKATRYHIKRTSPLAWRWVLLSSTAMYFMRILKMRKPRKQPKTLSNNNKNRKKKTEGERKSYEWSLSHNEQNPVTM